MSALFDFADTFRSVGTGIASQASCYEWSTRRRIMGHPFPGPFSAKFHPWVREILDSKAEYNITLKSAQGGFTEVGINKALYTLDICKRDVLYVLPTASNANDFSQARFGGALNASPYLKSMFTATNKVSLKQAGSTNLYIRGSRGDSNLKSVPASVLILDEFDEMDQKAVGLALERLSGQLVKEVWFISTPTIPNYGVHKEYQDSTQEHFTFQCPHCSRWTELTFPDCVEIVGEGINDPRIRESHLKCKECGHKLDHEDKPSYLRRGKWNPTYTNGHSSRRGFHINQLYSFTVHPWEIATAFFKGQTDEANQKEFNNSKLGLPFVGDGAQVTDDQIDKCIGSHSINDVRPVTAGRVITMGVDQGKTGYGVVVEWYVQDIKDPFREVEARVLDYFKFDQNGRGFSEPEMKMPEWLVLAAVVDADPEISLARAFAKKYRKYIWLSRYRKGVTGNEMSISDVDTGAPIATVDRTHWLSQALGLFKRGCIQIPRESSNEFKTHMKNLVATWTKDVETGENVQTFVSVGPDHFAHALTYAAIALPMALKKAYSGASDI